jgi:hypothetical protein
MLDHVKALMLILALVSVFYTMAQAVQRGRSRT